MYTRSHNVNKKSSSAENSPPKKRLKLDFNKHDYPAIPPLADDETSRQRNLELLKEESKKPKLCNESIRCLMVRTYGTRRLAILNGEWDFPILK